MRARDRAACVARTRVRAEPSAASAREREYVRTSEGDRPTEIKSTSGRARGERPRSAYLLPLAKERRRSTRGRVTPECPRFLLSVPSLLSLARLVPLALTRVPQSSPSPLGRALSVSFFSPLSPLSRSRRTTPHPWGTHYLSFFLYFLCPPLVQMARTISRLVSCPTVSCTSDEYSFR